MTLLARPLAVVLHAVQTLRLGVRALNRQRLYRRRRSKQVTYAQWIRCAEGAAPLEGQGAGEASVGLVLQVAAGADPAALKRTVASVTAQRYPHWRLRVVLLPGAPASDGWGDARIDVVRAEPGAVLQIPGEWTASLDVGDELRPHTLQAMMHATAAHPAACVVYADEDRIDADGRRTDHHFKPDWNLDLERSTHYVGHAVLLKAGVLADSGGWVAGQARADVFGRVLRAVEGVPAEAVCHVAQVLWHKGADAPRGLDASFIAPLQRHLDRVAPGARAVGLSHGTLQVVHPLPKPPPRVSIVICTRDQRHLLETCVESIFARTRYPAFEVIVVDNGSQDPSTLSYLAGLASGPRPVKVLRDDSPFNYSALNNAGVAQSTGEVVALLNNDIEVIGPDWLSEMVGHALRPEVGCVGAKLLYPDDTVQHVGVHVQVGARPSDGIAAHYLRGIPADDPGYAGRAVATQELTAVTAACLVMRKATFTELGGFDGQNLAVTYSDVDLCLRARRRGLRNIFTPHALLYHHESVSRGSDSSRANAPRFQAELAYMHGAWHGRYDRDPFYNPNFSAVKPDYHLDCPAG